MRLSILGLAFVAAASAAPAAITDTSLAARNIDAPVDAPIDLTKRQGGGGGILGLKGLLSPVFTSINSLSAEIDATLVSAVKSLDPATAKTLKKLLAKSAALTEELEKTVLMTVSTSTVKADIKALNRITAKLDKLDEEVVRAVSPNLADLVEQLNEETATLVEEVEKALGLL